MKKIHFEDQGQDLLWFVINPETELIVKAGPFHNSIYAGAWVPNCNLKEGDFIEYSNKFGPAIIKYPIVKIEDYDNSN